MLLGVRLLGTTCWCGFSKLQPSAAQMHLVETNNYRSVPTPLRSTSPFSEHQRYLRVPLVQQAAQRQQIAQLLALRVEALKRHWRAASLCDGLLQVLDGARA